MIRISYIILLFCLLLPSNLLANIKFTAEVDKTTINLGERIVLTYRINSAVSEFKPPAFKPFVLLKGPEISRTNDLLVYSYILQAKESGSYRLSPAMASVQGKNYFSEAIEVQVKESNSSNLPQSITAADPLESEAQSILKQYIYITPEFNNSKFYLGEPIVLQYVLYAHSNILLTEITEIEPPLFQNTWVEEEDIGTLFWENVIINNTDFKRAILRKFILIPLKEGNFNVPEFKFHIAAKLEYSEDFSNNDYYETEIYCSSEKRTIELIRLPKQEEHLKTNAIGQFQVVSNLTKSNIYIGEQTNLVVKLIGNGNLINISAPLIELPNGLNLHNVNTIDSIAIKDGMHGSRTFVYTFSSDSAGEFEIGLADFTFFSISETRFVSLSSYKHLVSVENVIFISENDNTSLSRIIIIIFVAIVALSIVYIYFRRIRNKPNTQEKDIDYIGIIADVKLSDNHFFDKLHYVFKEYFLKNYSINISTNSFNEIKDELQKHKFDENTIKDIESLLTIFNQVRFSKVFIINDLTSIKEQLSKIIKELETKKQQH